MFGLSKLRTVEVCIALVLTLAALLVFGLRAWSTDANVIHVSDAWARPTAGKSATSAVYLTIANRGEGDDVLKSVRTPKAKSVELHQTSTTPEGVMRMRQVEDGLPIEAGKSLALEPGGLHLMLLGLEEALRPGETLPMTLEFAKAGAVEIAVPVSAQGPDKSADTGHAHH